MPQKGCYSRQSLKVLPEAEGFSVFLKSALPVSVPKLGLGFRA